MVARLLQALLLAATVVNSQTLPTSTAKFEIRWKSCSNTTTDSKCGQLQVPIDWSNPSGAQLTLGVFRASSNSTNKPKLLFNPGGPGVATSTLCSAASLAFGPDLLNHYDLICPDPRGVGSSTPVKCDPEIWTRSSTYTPRNESEFKAVVELSRLRGESCLNKTGDLLRYIDTRSAAYDLEAIRLALGGEKLNWLGQSYGSMLGAQYAELFPQNVGAFAFDGIENHALDPATTLFVKSTTYQDTLDQFFDWCGVNATRCGWYGENLPKKWNDLITNASFSPIPAPGCTGNPPRCRSSVLGDEIVLNAQNLLTWQNTTLGVLPGWSQLGQALNQTIGKNDATLFSTPIATSDVDAIYPGVAIECLDWRRFANATNNISTAYASLKQLQTMGKTFNPSTSIYSNAYAREINCAGWPIQPVGTQKPLNATAAASVPPILMVTSNHDPFTSYVWALGVKTRLPSAVLLTREGNGHTSYFLRGEASKAIEAFLVNATLPADGTTVSS